MTDKKLEENKVTIRRFVEEFKNRANHGIVDTLFAPNFVHHFPDSRLPHGREGMKLLGRSVVVAFPDVHATIEDMVAEGDRVVERTTARATHKGVFNGIPATGKKVVWTETHVYRLENGKVVEYWPQIDMLALLMQIGAIPSPK